MKYILSIIALFVSLSLFAQTQKSVITETIRVEGTCGMCKKRIEKAAYIKGVKRADWDKATQTLTVTFNSKQTNLDKIALEVANVGHTANGIEADSNVIDKLPKCCDYRDPNAHKNHNH